MKIFLPSGEANSIEGGGRVLRYRPALAIAMHKLSVSQFVLSFVNFRNLYTLLGSEARFSGEILEVLLYSNFKTLF